MKKWVLSNGIIFLADAGTRYYFTKILKRDWEPFAGQRLITYDLTGSYTVKPFNLILSKNEAGTYLPIKITGEKDNLTVCLDRSK